MHRNSLVSTVQPRILKYAEAIDWTVVPRGEVEECRRFAPHPGLLPVRREK